MEITTEKILREEIKELTAELDEVKGDLEMAQEKTRIAQGTAMERKKKIEKLEKQLEEVDVDFIRVVHAREVEQLREILDACEAANAKHLARIDHLESVYWKHWREREELRMLCQDLYRSGLVAAELKIDTTDKWVRIFKPRMEQLGLLEGEQND